MPVSTYLILLSVVLITYAIAYSYNVEIALLWCKRNPFKSVVMGIVLALWHLLTLWLLNSLGLSILVYLWAAVLTSSFVYKAAIN